MRIDVFTEISKPGRPIPADVLASLGPITKGDFEGHPFRGNQYTGGFSEISELDVNRWIERDDDLKTVIREPFRESNDSPGKGDPAVALKQHVERSLREAVDNLNSSDKFAYEFFARRVIGWTVKSSTKFAYPKYAEQVSPERQIISAWADSSMDTSPVSVIMQMVAQKEFGLGESIVEKDKQEFAATFLKASGDPTLLMQGARVFLRTMYNNTQKMFAEQGIREITLFRGVYLKKTECPPEWASYGNYGSESNVSMTTHPLSSFTSSIETAVDFGGAGYGGTTHSIVMAAKIPVSRILSCPCTGYGCYAESEFIVLGGKDKYHLAIGSGALQTERVESSLKNAIKRSRAQKADEPFSFFADWNPENEDWTKKTWDLPPYKSNEFLALVPDLDRFRTLPVYQHAVKRGLIANDEWVGPVERKLKLTDAMKAAAIVKGDFEGHPFRGNQYTEFAEFTAEDRKKADKLLLGYGKKTTLRELNGSGFILRDGTVVQLPNEHEAALLAVFPGRYRPHTFRLFTEALKASGWLRIGKGAGFFYLERPGKLTPAQESTVYDYVINTPPGTHFEWEDRTGARNNYHTGRESLLGMLTGEEEFAFARVAKSQKRLFKFTAGKLTPKAKEAQRTLASKLRAKFRKMSDIAAATTKLYLGSRKLDLTIAAMQKVIEREPDKFETGEWEALVKIESAQEIVDRIMRNLKDQYADLPEDVQNQLIAASLAEIAAQAIEIGVTDEGLLHSVNEAAAEWSRRRAAEMVGMRRLADGTLVLNPNARWQITDTTRGQLRAIFDRAFASETYPMTQLIEDVKNAGAFSDYRAEMIARTEVGIAQSQSIFDFWKKTGMVKTYDWINTESGNLCDMCRDIAEAGPYVIGSGPMPIWDSHPNCQCDVVANEIEQPQLVRVAVGKGDYEGHPFRGNQYENPYYSGPAVAEKPKESEENPYVLPGGRTTHDIVYHGTVDEVIDSILKEGIVPKYERRNYASPLYEGERGRSVYAADDEKSAVSWAERGYDSKHPYREPGKQPKFVVFKLVIPRDAPDSPRVNYDRYSSGVQITGEVKPEWIVGYTVFDGPDGNYKPIHHVDLHKSEGQTFYVAVAVYEDTQKADAPGITTGNNLTFQYVETKPQKWMPWYGVDLDGTLAMHDAGHSGVEEIGDPIPRMVARVKQWLESGKEVRIFTARVADPATADAVRTEIQEWCKEHIGQVLPVTNEKDPGMIELWDDRAHRVARNTGEVVKGDFEGHPFRGNQYTEGWSASETVDAPWKLSKEDYIKSKVGERPSGEYKDNEAAWDKYFDDVRPARKEWERQTLAAVSEGKISPEEAEKNGLYHEYEWKELPDTLYHVTTAASAIAREGFKSRDALALGSGRGLGGGDSQSVSLTASMDTALSIHDALLEGKQVLNGELTIEDMLSAAQHGEGAGRSWLNSLLKHYGAKEGAEGLPTQLDALLRGKTVETGMGSPPTHLESNKGFDWKPATKYDKGWMGGDGEMKYSLWERDLTEKERLEDTFQFYKAWIAFREEAGGKTNPVFFLSDVEHLKAVDPKEIKILKLAPSPGAKGKYLGIAENEYRIFSSKAVRIVGDASPKKVSKYFSGEVPYDDMMRDAYLAGKRAYRDVDYPDENEFRFRMNEKNWILTEADADRWDEAFRQFKRGYEDAGMLLRVKKGDFEGHPFRGNQYTDQQSTTVRNKEGWTGNIADDVAEELEGWGMTDDAGDSYKGVLDSAVNMYTWGEELSPQWFNKMAAKFVKNEDFSADEISERNGKLAVALVHGIRQSGDVGDIHRGMLVAKDAETEYDKLKNGSVFSVPGVASFSTKEKIARDFTDPEVAPYGFGSHGSETEGQPSRGILIHITGAKGLVCGKHSSFPEQYEVLTNGKFRVARVNKSKDGNLEIWAKHEGVY
jgi:hypothetical protein